MHKITKLENHEGKEITAEELIDQYYKDPDKYFEANGGQSNAAPGGAATAIAVSRTSMALAKSLEIKNIKNNGVRDEYSLEAKNRDKSQQTLKADIKSIQSEQEQSTKLFDLSPSNNFLIFKCYYCSYETNVEREYESHVVMRHHGKPAYTSEIDLGVESYEH
jgi:hypothetical protein